MRRMDPMRSARIEIVRAFGQRDELAAAYLGGGPVEQSPQFRRGEVDVAFPEDLNADTLGVIVDHDLPNTDELE